MNRFLKYLALAALAVVGVVACSSEPKREPISSDFAFYLNGYQLVEKSGILEQITESNRLMMASTASSQVSMENSEFLKSVITDLDNSGLSLTKPVYALLNFNENSEDADLTAVVEVHDAESVDRLVSLISEVSLSQGGDAIEVVHEEYNRYINFTEDGFCVAYNENRMVVCVAEGDLKLFVDNALAAPLADLRPFGERDLAFYCNNNRLVDIIEKQYSRQLADYGDIESLNMLANIEEYRESLDENSSSIIGLTFDNGKIVFDTKLEGVDMADADWLKDANGNNLDKLPKETLALVNLSVDGEKFMEYVNEQLTEDVVEALGFDRNEFYAGLAVATDAISSIDGDVSIALNNLDGIIEYGYPEPSYVEAIMLADVEDTYIIDNFKMFGGAYFTRTADGYYTLPVASTLHINIGQDDNTLFAGVNATITDYKESAEEARWAEIVENSYGACMVVDVEQFMKARFVSDLFKVVLEDIDEPIDGIVAQIVDITDYIYARANDRLSGEFVWAFDNKEVNSLRQISDVVVPYVMAYAASQM